jgi:hypothetical protein
MFLGIPYRAGLAKLAINVRIGAVHAFLAHINTVFHAGIACQSLFVINAIFQIDSSYNSR